jgi:serine/threonine protein kinase
MQEWGALLRDFELGPGGTVPPYSIPTGPIPTENIDSSIRLGSNPARAYIYPKGIVNHGVNCLIQKGIRKSKGGETALIAIKRPRYTHRHLLAEALVQALTSSTLEAAGIRGAIPKVYDIYTIANEVRFTMEWVEGHSGYEQLHKHLLNPLEFRRQFLHIIIQLSFLLHTIHKRIRLDHRDMKLDNIWIRLSPITYTISPGRVYSAPFQVVLLDFGFACIGNTTNTMQLNLGGVIPDLDACPKEGRDLYHILNRILEPLGFTEVLGPELHSAILEKMKPVGPSYQRRSHVLTSMPGFGLPELVPAAILDWALHLLDQN